MFVGAVPRPAVEQITRSVPFTDWRQVFVGCSGSFRFDRAVRDVHPTVAVHSNDVSLLSCSLGALATRAEFPIAFKGRLAFIEGLVAGQPFVARAAAVEVALEMAKYKGLKPYAQAHFPSGRSRRAFDSGSGLPQRFGRAMARWCEPAARPCQGVTPTVQRLGSVLRKGWAATASRLRGKRSGGCGIASFGQRCSSLPSGKKRLGIGKCHWDTIKLCANALL